MLSQKKNSQTMQYSKLLLLGAVTGLLSLNAWAEPPVQPGETLESLSKARITTTVNGQNASLENLVNSGQIRLIQPTGQAPAPAMQQPMQQPMPQGQPPAAMQPGAPQDPNMQQDPAIQRQMTPPGSMPMPAQPNDPRTLPEMQQEAPTGASPSDATAR
ncbi:MULTISPECIES: hypothetical protein [unclassified Acinetobacter]|uniref:hypothetical protein n=1 Tax=Acinetobacter TaxID=469 RepID=UPI0005382154|nr:hypothetical protein [Acinetobacter sp. HR7]KGT46059.1 hypothetical protein GW12_29200 [Acinetobacter sp. HR7]